MTHPLSVSLRTLWLLLRMSSLCLLAGAGIVIAHEVEPTIADLSVTGDSVRVAMRVNIEAQLSGIDLDAISDTNDAENPEDYDDLRALSRAEVAARAEALVARWNDLPLLRAGDAPVPLTLESVAVPDLADTELPRISDLVLTGTLPEGAQAVTVAWPDGSGGMVLRQQGVDDPFTGLIDGGGDSGPVRLGGGDAAGGWQTFFDYIPVGFDHIVPKGLDHILFVLGLFFLSTRLGPLLWQVSAFTLAHTVTLALGALGIVTVPASIVEPLIAASIVFVAVENIFSRGLHGWRPAIVFGFGLLHGLGFASVLGEFGLPEGTFIPALIGFNVGVELGQLAVIAAAALTLWLGVMAARQTDFEGQEETITDYNVMFRAWSVTGSLIIAVVAIWWVIERTLL